MEFKNPYKNINNRKFNTWCKYTLRIDTYGCGCEHNCCYCYAKTLLSFRGLWNKTPKIASIQNIENIIINEFAQLKLNFENFTDNIVVKLGGMTDCFQPVELENKVTYKTILLLNKYKIHYLIVTKSDLVINDNYLKIYDKNLAHFQITITSTDDKKCIEYEHAPVTSKRIKAVELLQKLGYDVSVRLSPFIPDFIDFKAINKIKCDKILIEFLKVNHFVKKWFNIDYSNYMVKFGGYRHLPLFEKIQYVSKITGFKQKTVGEYVSEHHDYFSKHVNFNKNDCCNLKLF